MLFARTDETLYKYLANILTRTEIVTGLRINKQPLTAKFAQLFDDARGDREQTKMHGDYAVRVKLEDLPDDNLLFNDFKVDNIENNITVGDLKKVLGNKKLADGVKLWQKSYMSFAWIKAIRESKKARPDLPIIPEDLAIKDSPVEITKLVKK